MALFHLPDLPDSPDPLPGDAVPLSRLAPGRRAIIERVDPELPTGRRLLDLGFVPDSPIRAVRRAPLGDPIAFDVRGTRMCLRASEAELIWVRELDADVEPE